MVKRTKDKHDKDCVRWIASSHRHMRMRISGKSRAKTGAPTPKFDKYDYKGMEKYWAPCPSHVDMIIYDHEGKLREMDEVYALSKRAFGGPIDTWTQSELGFYSNLAKRIDDIKLREEERLNEARRMERIEETVNVQGYEEWEAAW